MPVYFLPDEETITDSQARKIAADWHSPASTGLTALSTTGAITEDVGAEIVAEIDGLNAELHPRGVFDALPSAMRQNEINDGIKALRDLEVYVTVHGPREAVPGWSNVNY
ncbi:hypothetical protein ACFY2K_26330 [Kitasatospora sp. NPDC001309]|uniref:hypothetical protein n=1 Tax=Kitasatospora sp. NPDC001309 TaxID=3364013 RepID=UPI0036A60789